MRYLMLMRIAHEIYARQGVETLMSVRWSPFMAAS
jgi:hypothetical protein